MSFLNNILTCFSCVEEKLDARNLLPEVEHLVDELDEGPALVLLADQVEAGHVVGVCLDQLDGRLHVLVDGRVVHRPHGRVDETRAKPLAGRLLSAEFGVGLRVHGRHLHRAQGRAV
jgi:hypothetical protein